MVIKNLEKTAKRILKAIKNDEKIILYGDADLDGVASVIILKETFKNLGGKIATVYFPDREKEGYGINETALNYLKKFAPAILIALDCGIGNFKEAKLAKKLGFEVIIIDHHEILDSLPEASIIVDPKQRGDKYPFKELATSGIAFKLSKALHPKMPDSLKRNSLELVALSTIADMMPEKNENKVMIEEGLRSLKNSWRPGLRAFLKINEYEPGSEISQFRDENIRQTAQKIISALNAAEVKDHLNEAYLFLTQTLEKEAEEIAKDLLERRYQKQEKIKEIVAKIEEKALEKIGEPIIFEGESSFPLVLLGTIASRLCNIYKKPIFLFKKGEIESRGAVRTPPGVNSVEVMKNCSKFLETYGGHPLASGFSIKNENLEKFKKCLIKYFSKHAN